MESASASVPCPECGAPTSAGELCDECYADGVEPLAVPDEIEVRVCAKCGSYVRDGGWTSHDEPLPDEELAVAAVKDELRMHVEAREPRLSLGVESRDTNTLEVSVEAVAYVRGYRVEDERAVRVRLKHETCPTCAKRSGGYYESVVQIRAEGREPTEDETERALEHAYGIAGRDYGDRDTFVTKTQEVRGGLDIYMSTNDAGMQVARRMTDEYGGSYDDSATLVGEKEGEELYRVTYAVSLPEFVPGDVVVAEDTPLLVTHNDGVLKGIDLRTGDKRSFSDVSPERIGRADDAEPTTVVSVSDDGKEIQVLDPETYETVTVPRPSFVVVSQGEEVKVLSSSEGVYPVPEAETNKNS
ncbi:MAG: NMD3-related protein [Halobacteriales archaeon]|nr:NMD3-related protein [Halobacteriales archaeon]